MFGFGNYSGRPNKPAPTNVNRPGTSSPNFSGYSRPKKDNKSQPVIRSFASSIPSSSRKQYYDKQGAGPVPLQDIQNITSKYKRSADIPGYQAKMKDYQAFQQAQADGGIARYTQGPLKGQQILSMRQPTLTAMAPTFKQFMGDVGRGIGNLAQAGANLFTGGGMLGNIFRGIGGFFQPGQQTVAPTIIQPIYGGGGNNQGPKMNLQTEQYQSLNATQQSIYDMLIKEGKSHAEALAQALAQKLPKPEGYMPDYVTGFRSGGIATFN